MPQRPVELVVTAPHAGSRLDQFLAAQGLPHSRSQIKRRIDEGEVRVNDEAGRPAQRLKVGDRVSFTPPEPLPATPVAEAIPLAVLYEDEHLIVVDKPAGMVVHPAAGHAAGTLVNALLAHCPDLPGIGGERRPGIVHRLDKLTSGVLVVAKDEPTMVGLQAQIKEHTVNRSYVALVDGRIERVRGRFETLYGRHPRRRTRFTTKVTAGKSAITNWSVTERLGGATLVEARLETGRTHQIRVHFREHGHPVVGDPVYGRPSRDPVVRSVGRALGRQALHARLLGFVHPATGEELELTAPVPDDLATALTTLRRSITTG